MLLPDNRLFMVLRTLSGVWYSVSEDDGATWRDTEPLRYHDEGETIPYPYSPTPLFALKDGRFLLQGGRWPITFSMGKSRHKAHQPIWFSQPKKFAANEGGAGDISNRGEIGTYSSLTEDNGRRILWYPDRKLFLLGRYVSDRWLSDLEVPGDD